MTRIAVWSMASRVAGTSPAAITADTASPAASRLSKATIRVRTAGGRRRSLR